jgi:branched-chain amino acid transport system ATP-binding protein
MSSAMLSMRDAAVRFGGVAALVDVDVTVSKGRVTGLIGPNGAGKTTAVNALTGFVRLTSGRITLNAHDVTRASPVARARRGLARTYQGGKLFGGLTVFENVEVGALAVGASRRDARRRAWELLDLMGLRDRWGERADGLSHGDERRVGILRALASRPDFLMLDEPAAGLNEPESDALAQVLATIQDRFELGILLIDHDIRFVMAVCADIQVLDHGQTIAVGEPAAIRADPRVREAYLGGSHRDDPEVV